jgi:hypothetical protein
MYIVQYMPHYVPIPAVQRLQIFLRRFVELCRKPSRVPTSPRPALFALRTSRQKHKAVPMHPSHLHPFPLEPCPMLLRLSQPPVHPLSLKAVKKANHCCLRRCSSRRCLLLHSAVAAPPVHLLQEHQIQEWATFQLFSRIQVCPNCSDLVCEGVCNLLRSTPVGCSHRLLYYSLFDVCSSREKYLLVVQSGAF